MGTSPAALHATARGWINHVRYANTLGLRMAGLGRAAPTGNRAHQPIDERFKSAVSTNPL